MGKIDLVPALLVQNDLVVVKDLEVVVLHKTGISEVDSTLQKLDVDGSRSVICRRDEDLLLKDDPVFGRHILVGIFHWLASDGFGEIEDFLVCVHIDC